MPARRRGSRGRSVADHRVEQGLLVGRERGDVPVTQHLDLGRGDVQDLGRHLAAGLVGAVPDRERRG